MAKITPVLWKYKTNSDGESPLKLRVADTESTLYYALGLTIAKRHWNDRSNTVRKSHPRSDELNALLSKKKAKAEQLVLSLDRQGTEPTARAVVEALRGKREVVTDFFTYADRVVDQFERQGKIHTHKRYKSVCKKFRTWTGKPLPFNRLTVQLLRRYETHLVEHYGNAPSTVASNFRAIRAILYRAIDDGLASQEANPFFSFSIKPGKTDRIKLTLDEIEALEAVEAKPGSRDEIARDAFMLSFYCAGIRFSDVCQLRWKHVMGKLEGEDAHLRYTMSKTGTTKEIPLMPGAREILRRYRPENPDRETYVFPLLVGYEINTARDQANAISSQNMQINRALKRLADRAEISKSISFHIARHSFADLARRKGWSVYDISKALGHSSLKVTEKYLAGFDKGGLSDKMNNLFSGGADGE
ncbi:MAG: tyrosine-type recombinase/integrase [Bacteroidetes bacterium]|jgi:integrase|nr:tyrosine-type recombinase/integrase [Bacteroidota bacterium]